MFAYCLNSPTRYQDSTGNRAKFLPLLMDETGNYYYITDQHDAAIANLRFGIANVSHSGCGIIASYNALITLGNGRSFEEVLAYYNENILTTIGWGAIGLFPQDIANYFETLGCTVVVTYDKSEINQLSQTADACIMYYEFDRTYSIFGFIPFDAYGAHFIEYHRVQNGYIGLNTNGANGISSISSPAQYGYQGINYYAVGIFIVGKE